MTTDSKPAPATLQAPAGADEGPANRPALVVEGLQKTFPGMTTPVFRDVSFEIATGASVALIGANGTGKSTLLRSCLRLVEPDAGSVTFEDEELTALRGSALSRARARIGFVFQKHNLVPRLSALTNVVHGALARRSGVRYWRQSWAPAEEREFAIHCLERVGLAGIALRQCRHLSGGQSQRVAVARALMQRASAIFADEPVASLDPVAGEEVMELFHSLSREDGLTLVFVSHDLDHAVRFSDRVLGLRGGELALDLTSAEAAAMDLREFYG